MTSPEGMKGCCFLNRNDRKPFFSLLTAKARKRVFLTSMKRVVSLCAPHKTTSQAALSVSLSLTDSRFDSYVVFVQLI